MPKADNYKKGIGPYSGQDDIKFQRPASPSATEKKDISRVVDRNHRVNDGFSGALESKE